MVARGYGSSDPISNDQIPMTRSRTLDPPNERQWTVENDSLLRYTHRVAHNVVTVSIACTDTGILAIVTEVVFILRF